MSAKIIMENILRDLEEENCELINRITEIEAEKERLSQENSTLEKALEKQKRLHRKFSDDVVESERIRNDDFRSEKRSLIDGNQVLVKENRQLSKDVLFYKKAYEEVSKEDKSASDTKHPNQRSEVSDTLATEAPPVQPVRTKRLTRSATQSVSTSASACSCNHKSSRELTKISEKLLTENKKLKLKNNEQSATVLLLKKKNRSLENFKDKMVKKKEKFSQEADELEWLAESTKMKNSETFNPEVLTKLGQFSK